MEATTINLLGLNGGFVNTKRPSREEGILNRLNISKSIPKWVLDARKNFRELNALVNGVGFSDMLVKIEHLEDDDKVQARKKYSRNVVDLFERLFRPLDNIYHTTGNTVKFEPDLDKNIKDVLNNVTGGKSIKGWLETYWMKKLYHVDSNGLIFLEYIDRPYPTYKCINSIRNYETDGQKVLWIIFEPYNIGDKVIYRYVDDTFDNEYELVGDEFKLHSQLKHNFTGVCPALVISDRERLGTELRETPLHGVVPLCKEYLRDVSISTLFKFKHGFPMFWRYAIECKKCKGSGKVDGHKCNDCDGHGFYLNKDVLDAIILGMPRTNDEIKIAPDIAGYVVPPIEMLDKFDSGLKLLELMITDTYYGMSDKSLIEKTATEIITDYQPKINKLNRVSDVAQYMDKTLTEYIILFYNKDSVQVQISYGRNFIIEPISVLLQRYEQSKTTNVNAIILDRMLLEWIYAKFGHDQVMLDIQLKRFRFEPYIHYDYKTILELFGWEESGKKLLFDEFAKTANFYLDDEQFKAEWELYLEDRLEEIEESKLECQSKELDVMNKSKGIDSEEEDLEYNSEGSDDSGSVVKKNKLKLNKQSKVPMEGNKSV